MKKYWIICIVGLCACSKPTPPPTDMLVGKWVRTNDEDSMQTHEMWQQTDSSLTGVGFTMKNGEVVFEEKMEIIKEHKDYFLVVRGVNSSPTKFKFTHWNNHSFTCENQKNAFPKKINYRMVNNFMIAQVTGNNDTLDFNFIKIPFQKEGS